ncbi:D-alanyl-D-alanine carboxypeptidase family protein [Celeribacter sp.]|uniref:D-alanyl-D-alanine carboxypeptidase family protein n=1 Tax=Celeribacter sp. TaxID=1890673 RepID=UPI003A8F18DB
MIIGVSAKVMAAEYAALVMDARNGNILHSSNADTRLHPASLTKMMTLYIAFEAVENGEIGLDTLVTISKNAAAEPPSKLGLKPGQKIKLRYLIRAAAVKSANDAATAIGEAIEGSEAAFARRMNRTAKDLGMSRTTFKNAHGLTATGHLSTARDMSVLGRHVFYDYPGYYNIFSRTTADAGVRTVTHTNSRFLNSYAGADGIKTGYTSAAGFNLVASAERGRERIITTVFGGRSTASRNARVTELMDLGFKRAPSNVAVVKPKRPPYRGKTAGGAEMVASAQGDIPGLSSKTIRVTVNITKSPIPKPRPMRELAPEEETLLVAMSDDILNAVTQAQETEQVLALAEAATTQAAEVLEEVTAQVAPAGIADIAPTPRPASLQLVAITPTVAQLPARAIAAEAAPEIVTRLSTSGSRHWGVNIGTYGSEYEARKVLLKTALTELDMLDGALRKVVKSNRGYQANFLGLTEDLAGMTCRRLAARGVDCNPIGPT